MIDDTRTLAAMAEARRISRDLCCGGPGREWVGVQAIGWRGVGSLAEKYKMIDNVNRMMYDGWRKDVLDYGYCTYTSSN